MLEKQIQKNVLRFCKTNGILARKLNAESHRGWPDLVCVLPNGKVHFLEIKTPEGRLSKLQRRTIQELKNNNANVHVIRSIEEAIFVLSQSSTPKPD